PPRFTGLHLGEPLPRLADAAREQPLRHREVAVAHEAVPVLVARMEDLDPGLHVLRLRPVRRSIPEDLPHVLRRRVQLDRELMALHGRECKPPLARTYPAINCCTDCARPSSHVQLCSKCSLPSVITSRSHQNP